MTAESQDKTGHLINSSDWDQIVKVTCHANCSYQGRCVLNAFVKDGKVLRVEQDTDYLLQNDPNLPDWNPRGCQKGLVMVHRMYDGSRVLYPLKRVGERGEGKWKQVSWDQALTDIADITLDVLTTEGNDTILRFPGSGGGQGPETASYIALMQALGIPHTALQTDLGDEHQGCALVFGQPYVGSSVDNWYYADILLVWGGNPAFTNVTNYHFLTEARYNGTKVITISPDFSASAIQADLWIPINIGTDAALALSISHVIISEKLYKADFIKEQTDMPILVRLDNKKFLRQADMTRGGRDDVYYFWDKKTNRMVEAPLQSLALGSLDPALEGEYDANTLGGRVKVKPVFEILSQKLQDYAPEKASVITGISSRLIVQLARDIARSRGVVNVSTFNWGKFYNGDEIERSIILIFSLCGHMGRKGATYNGYTGLFIDSTVTGVAISGWATLRNARINDPRYSQWKNAGYTDEMIILEYGRDSVKSGGILLSAPFHYFHSGLLEQSIKHNSWDLTLKRPIADYVKEAMDKRWQFVTPKPGKSPRIIFNMLGNFLRRCRSTDMILKTLLPKLKLIVAIDHRMSATGMYADYILPSAIWFEKYSLVGYAKIDLPWAFLSSKAAEPLGRSKNEWEIGCLMAKKIQERAKARGISSFTTNEGKTIRLDNLYNKVTANGLYTDDDEEAVTRDYYANATNIQQVPWDDFKEKGAVPGIELGWNPRSIGNACDIVPGETAIPLTWHIRDKLPYPTQTRRQQYYIDHELYLELEHELPGQRVDPKVGGNYPLRLTGGHARWSIHSCQVDDAILLSLQRGGPVLFMNLKDAQTRGIEDGEMVEIYNDVASFRVRIVASPNVKPGQTIIYHAWENYQFPEFKHFKNVMASGLNPIELAGGYYHIAPTADCFSPGFSDRETRVDVRKIHR